MKMVRLLLLPALLILLGHRILAADPPITPEMLTAWLKQYPDADTDHNGALSEAEARAYYAKMQAAAPKAPAPTQADLRYGAHPRQVLDFWKAESPTPTPVVVYIYGGGFVSGDKSTVRSMHLIRQCLSAGVSVAAINYRYLSQADFLQDILHDGARAVQFLRSQAHALNIDPTRVAACGHSAGAGMSLWLAFHPEMADPGNLDPVLRESTRLSCAVAWDGQFTYDMPLWGKYFGEDNRRKYGGIYNSPEIYGLKSAADLSAPAGLKARAECDYYGMISSDDPPVYLGSGLRSTDLDDMNQYLHHPTHARLVYDRCRELGVTAVAKIPALKIFPEPDAPPYGEVFMFKYLKPPVQP